MPLILSSVKHSTVMNCSGSTCREAPAGILAEYWGLNHLVEKDRNQWLIQFTDKKSGYSEAHKSVEMRISRWTFCAREFRTAFKRSSLPSLCIWKKWIQTNERLFNECMIHVCFDSVDNYNHAVNHVCSRGAIRICVDKGPVLETVCPDGIPLSTKKEN